MNKNAKVFVQPRDGTASDKVQTSMLSVFTDDVTLSIGRFLRLGDWIAPRVVSKGTLPFMSSKEVLNDAVKDPLRIEPVIDFPVWSTDSPDSGSPVRRSARCTRASACACLCTHKSWLKTCAG